MIHIPKVIKYLLWSILALFVILLFSGAAVYRFDIPGYVEYLNTRDVSAVSLKSPMTLLHLFVPNAREEVVTLEDILSDTWYMQETGDDISLDPDFEDFFADFSQQDVSSVIITGEDFWFVAPVDVTASWAVVMTEDQQAAFLERLRQRELRLQEQGMVNQSWTNQ